MAKQPPTKAPVKELKRGEYTRVDRGGSTSKVHKNMDEARAADRKEKIQRKPTPADNTRTRGKK